MFANFWNLDTVSFTDSVITFLGAVPAALEARPKPSLIALFSTPVKANDS